MTYTWEEVVEAARKADSDGDYSFYSWEIGTEPVLAVDARLRALEARTAAEQAVLTAAKAARQAELEVIRCDCARDVWHPAAHAYVEARSTLAVAVDAMLKQAKEASSGSDR